MGLGNRQPADAEQPHEVPQAPEEQRVPNQGHQESQQAPVAGQLSDQEKTQRVKEGLPRGALEDREPLLAFQPEEQRRRNMRAGGDRVCDHCNILKEKKKPWPFVWKQPEHQDAVCK